MFFVENATAVALSRKPVRGNAFDVTMSSFVRVVVSFPLGILALVNDAMILAHQLVWWVLGDTNC